MRSNSWPQKAATETYTRQKTSSSIQYAIAKLETKITLNIVPTNLLYVYFKTTLLVPFRNLIEVVYCHHILAWWCLLAKEIPEELEYNEHKGAIEKVRLLGLQMEFFLLH